MDYLDGLDETIQLINDKKCVIFLGAGISQQAGCSSLEYIPESLKSLPIIKNEISRNPSFLPDNVSIPKIIDILFNKIRSNEEDLKKYEDILYKTISCQAEMIVDNKYSTLIKAIKKIYSFTNLMFTTNIDDCLSLTKYFDPKKGYKIFYKNKHFKIINLNKGDINGIYHLHGQKIELNGATFGENFYNDLYGDLGFENFLCYIFRQYSMIFIGKNLENDHHLMRIVELMRGTKHFALIKKKYSDVQKTNFLKKYNIKIIDYPNHDLLPDLLQSWVDKNFPETKLQQPTNSELREPGKEESKNV